MASNPGEGKPKTVKSLMAFVFPLNFSFGPVKEIVLEGRFALKGKCSNTWPRKSLHDRKKKPLRQRPDVWSVNVRVTEQTNNPSCKENVSTSKWHLYLDPNTPLFQSWGHVRSPGCGSYILVGTNNMQDMLFGKEGPDTWCIQRARFTKAFSICNFSLRK